jgi:hypothetical protein
MTDRVNDEGAMRAIERVRAALRTAYAGGGADEVASGDRRRRGYGAAGRRAAGRGRSVGCPRR